MCSMASEIDMLADRLLGARTEGRGKFGREGPAKARVEAMFVDVGLLIEFPEDGTQEEGRIEMWKIGCHLLSMEIGGVV